MKPMNIRVLLLTAWFAVSIGQALAVQPLTREAQRSRGQIAAQMFEERCKKAGEKIYRTEENVEGIFLMKVRPPEINFGKQFVLDDPYGHDSGGELYFKTFFAAFSQPPIIPSPKWRPKQGYHYVEAIDPQDGKRYRYTGGMKEVTHVSSILVGGTGKEFRTKDFVLDKTPAPGKPPRYGVTYDDISTREEREYWIAGSSLRVIDLQTNEVMAERIGYMMDPAQGNTSGGRSPWLLAARTSCPAFPSDPGGHPVQTDQTRKFVVRILKPVMDN